MKINRVILSGGGTGGHIFPALSIANEIRKRYPDSEILFVGAQGKAGIYYFRGMSKQFLYRYNDAISDFNTALTYNYRKPGNIY